MNHTASMTDLLRRPREVVARTDEGSVRITRRDAADLVLIRADELDRAHKGMALTLRIAHAALDADGDMLATLRRLYPWTQLFSPEAQVQFAKEVDGLVWSSAELGRFGQLMHTITSWEGTAEALADGLRPDDALTWLDGDDAPDVPEPA